MPTYLMLRGGGSPMSLSWLGASHSPILSMPRPRQLQLRWISTTLLGLSLSRLAKISTMAGLRVMPRLWLNFKRKLRCGGSMCNFTMPNDRPTTSSLASSSATLWSNVPICSLPTSRLRSKASWLFRRGDWPLKPTFYRSPWSNSRPRSNVTNVWPTNRLPRHAQHPYGNPSAQRCPTHPPRG